MITPLLKSALEPVVRRHRSLRSHLLVAAVWGAGAVAVIICHAAAAPKAIVVPVILTAACAAAWILSRRAAAWEPDYRAIARAVEQRHPQLHALLVTAVEQRPDSHTGALNFLQQRVVQQAIEASRREQWLDAVPGWRLFGARALKIAMIVAACLLLVKLPASITPKTDGASRASEPVTVTPGDANIERGSGLVVLAKFNRDAPSEAVLVISPKNEPAQRMPLVKNLDDPVFGGGLPEVSADLSYRIEYAGKATRDFNVRVFEHPRLERADATLRFPDYTKLPEKKMPDTRRVSAVEGTKLDVAFQLNKPVKSATLVAKDGAKVPLAVEPENAVAALRDFPVRDSRTWELQLIDADGRANKLPAQFVLEVLPNRRPELKFVTPKGDRRVSPIEEVAFRVEAWDDFGLARAGLTINVAGRGEHEIELARDTRADERREMAHTLKLEDLGVKPDELISWFLWAEDAGPDGKPRRTATDMFFAEVRPFEEIYKPGDGDGGGQQQGGEGEAMKLADLQKQIINATWNLKRTEDAAPKSPTDKYLQDEPVVRDSQGEALKKANALAQRADDAKTRALVETVTREMQSARDKLAAAATKTEPLPGALAAEQSAYNALLKLAAHQFRVMRSRNAQGRGQQQRNQRELDQLELKDEKQRYETKREAEPMQNEQQREQLAILNRLKELAQRQQDINERLKELQTALQEAKTEKEREEIRRQLKRLREEEQQMLADMDELRQKMEQSPQQSQLADERRQLDQTRAEAQRAAESLEKSAASQALASGTRTARDLRQMRDDFRKKTSGQFNDEMRQMRADARELAQRESEIAEKLKTEPKREQRTLDGGSEREQLTQDLEKQKGRLANVTDRMKNVSDQAEAAEPLLAKELYDALRKTTQAGTDQTLDATQKLAQRGAKAQAQKFEEKARKEIDELKAGVERAAESVLGDEAEALRQARVELDALTEQLNREIAKARPDLADARTQNRDGQRAGNSPNEARAASGDAEVPGSARVPRAGDGVSPSRTSENRERVPDRLHDPSANTPKEVRSSETPLRLGSGQAPPAGETPALPGNAPRNTGAPSDRQDRLQGERGARGESASNRDRDTPGEGERSRSGGFQPPRAVENRPSLEGNQRSQEGSQSETQPGNQTGNSQSQRRGEGNQGGEQPGQTAQNSSRQNATASGPQPDGQQSGRQQPGGRNATSRGVSENQSASATASGGRSGSRLADLANAPRQRGAANTGDGGGGPWGGGFDGQSAPLTGGNFVDWSDRLRNVEEMLDDPALRAEAARIRELAKGVRVEFKRTSAEPKWDMVKMKISTPLAELRDRLTEELARRESKENLVPIDRDPVPTKYAERVRRYYEELGRSR
jgi:hypothetical protein